MRGRWRARAREDLEGVGGEGKARTRWRAEGVGRVEEQGRAGSKSSVCGDEYGQQSKANVVHSYQEQRRAITKELADTGQGK